jgi:hypothetical protein
VGLICQGKLDSELRLNAAMEYVTKVPPNVTSKVVIFYIFYKKNYYRYFLHIVHPGLQSRVQQL